MNKLTTTLLAASALSSSALAQFPSYLTTYSQVENTTSGSGGTVLGTLRPNEVAHVNFAVPCTSLSAEKWTPRTCTHVMAGDTNADGVYFEPAILGGIDALLSLSTWLSPIPLDNQRTVYISPAAAMGTNISGAPGLRPGDVGRISRLPSDGQIEYFLTQEQVNQSLGLPPAYPIDIDAITYQPNMGVFFSIDEDVLANTACGPMLVRDGDVLCLPPWTTLHNPNLTVGGVAPNSAVVVYNEAQMNVFTANAMVADRFGACVTSVGDVEALHINAIGPVSTIVPCVGMTLTVPTLVYSCENGTGASLLTTAGGGSIQSTSCGLAGTPCSSGLATMGPQMGVRPTSLTIGVPSHINALTSSRVCTHILEPQQHVMPVFPAGAPAGATMIDYNNPFVLSMILVSLPSPVVPVSIPAFPFSQLCFPDIYTMPLIAAGTVPMGFGSFPMIAIPPLWTGKVMFQGVGFGSGTFELSTPAVIDVM